MVHVVLNALIAGVLFSALREVINAGGGKYTLTPNTLATEQGESYILVVTADTENGCNNDGVAEDAPKIRIRHEWVFDSVSISRQHTAKPKIDRPRFKS